MYIRATKRNRDIHEKGVKTEERKCQKPSRLSIFLLVGDFLLDFLLFQAAPCLKLEYKTSLRHLMIFF